MCDLVGNVELVAGFFHADPFEDYDRDKFSLIEEFAAFARSSGGFDFCP